MFFSVFPRCVWPLKHHCVQNEVQTSQCLLGRTHPQALHTLRPFLSSILHSSSALPSSGTLVYSLVKLLCSPERLIFLQKVCFMPLKKPLPLPWTNASSVEMPFQHPQAEGVSAPVPLRGPICVAWADSDLPQGRPLVYHGHYGLQLHNQHCARERGAKASVTAAIL